MFNSSITMEVTIKVKAFTKKKVGLFLIGLLARLFGIEMEADVSAKAVK